MNTITVSPVDQGLREALQHKIDQKTKPLGALGQLEALALQVGMVQATLCPELRQPTAFIFAGDHGITAEGVSPYPQAVTAQMVLNFVAGGAAINQFAQQMGFNLQVVDAGVNARFSQDMPIVHAKVCLGTRSFLEAPAMDSEECALALKRGAELVRTAVQGGTNVFAFGEMGIGNTTSAAALISVMCGLPPQQCVGRGTGLDAAGVAHKAQVIERALARHACSPTQPMQVLACLGGAEIAMMVGAMLQAASLKALILVDGFICSAALCVAQALQPSVLDYCVFSHCSDEAAHGRVLAFLGAKPLLDLGLRLGEGTGAVLAYPLLQAAVNFLNGMASFAEAGVSETSS